MNTPHPTPVQATFSGRLSLGNTNRVFQIVNDTAVSDLLLDAALIEGSSPAGFTKAGTGTLTLAGVSDNAYTGDTVVNAGVLELAKNTAVAIPTGLLTVGDDRGGPRPMCFASQPPTRLPTASPSSSTARACWMSRPRMNAWAP